MKLLYVGQFLTPQYDEAMANAFSRLGCEVQRIETWRYVADMGLYRRIQLKAMMGPGYLRLWGALLWRAVEWRPDVIYFRRPLEFPRVILRMVRYASGARLIEYMNDDPFGRYPSRRFLKYFVESLPEFDANFVFREINVREMQQAGARGVKVLWPYYVADSHYSASPGAAHEQRFDCDAIFVGHGEAGSRADCFDALLAAGLTLRLGGSGFDRYARGRPHARLLPTRYLAAEEYRTAIGSARCALCFFSWLNRDQLTTRVFEIPACGGLLVAERTPVVESLFRDREEAFFFSSPSDLVEIVRHLKEFPETRRKVAEAGRARVLSGGHDVTDRARAILSAL